MDKQNSFTSTEHTVATTALLIGGTGFVGRHLAHRLANDYDVVSTGRNFDIRDKAALKTLAEIHRPAIVVNLAALTTVRETVEAPRTAYDIAFTGLLNLFEALSETGFRGRFLEVSSSEVYGHPAPIDLPLKETSPFQPMSPYSVGKIAAEMLCFEWAQRASFDIMVARPFTHIGPGQSDRFAVARFAAQVARIMAGGTEAKISVGNLNATRDLTDVRDVVRAYDLILREGENGAVYNVCSGTEVSMRVVVDEIISLSGCNIEVCEDAVLKRSAEQQRLRGSFDILYTRTGWQPEISLVQTLRDSLAAASGKPNEGCTAST